MQTVNEVFLIRIAGQVVQGQNGDRIGQDLTPESTNSKWLFHLSYLFDHSIGYCNYDQSKR